MEALFGHVGITFSQIDAASADKLESLLEGNLREDEEEEITQ